MAVTIRDSDILFVVMPWASLQFPAFGASLLLRIIETAGFEGQVLYPGMELVEQTGWPFYEAMANDMGCYELSEHFFSCYLHGKDRVRSNEFLEELLRNQAAATQLLGSDRARRYEEIRDEIVPAFIENYAARIAERHIPIVGFSCTFNQVLASLALAKRIKTIRPEVRILFGGPSLDAEMGISHHAKYADIIDHVYLGEADRTITEIVRRLKTGESLDTSLGVTLRDDRRILWGELFTRTDKLDDLPAPDYDDFFVQRQELASDGIPLPAVGALSFETSRGCWWAVKRACSFCGINGGRHDVRVKAAPAVLSDLEELSARYATLNFRANDNLLEARRFAEILPGLEASGNDYALALQVRANLRRDEVAALKRGGVTLIQAGIESLSDHVLKLMRKGVSCLENIQMLKWCREYGIDAHYFILFGFPGETKEDYDRVAELVPLIAHLQPPARMQHIEIHRFSPMFDKPGDFGVEEIFMRENVGYVYPQDTLTGDLLYCFRFYSSKTVNADAYTARLREALQDWIYRFSCEQPRPVLEMRQGKDFLLVTDTRWNSATTHYIEGLERAVVLLSDAVIHRRKLHTAIKERIPAADPAAIDEAIALLQAKGLLLVENNRCLALPLPISRRTERPRGPA
jgi:ribosomal peptide maturation radical SAM protein 1